MILSIRIRQIADRTEPEVEVFAFEAERGLELGELVGELEKRLPHPLDLLVRERAGVQLANRLALEQSAQQLDQRKHQLGDSLAGVLLVGVDAVRSRAVEQGRRLGKLVEVAARASSEVQLRHVTVDIT